MRSQRGTLERGAIVEASERGGSRARIDPRKTERPHGGPAGRGSRSPADTDQHFPAVHPRDAHRDPREKARDVRPTGSKAAEGHLRKPERASVVSSMKYGWHNPPGLCLAQGRTSHKGQVALPL